MFPSTFQYERGLRERFSAKTEAPCGLGDENQMETGIDAERTLGERMSQSVQESRAIRLQRCWPL
jgi:hypothetical protein